MAFWISFGFLGVIGVPLIIMFLVCGATLKHKLGGAITTLIFWFLFAGGLALDGMNKAEDWNGGYCECGTHWELRGATKDRVGIETKYYICPSCYAEISR